MEDTEKRLRRSRSVIRFAARRAAARRRESRLRGNDLRFVDDEGSIRAFEDFVRRFAGKRVRLQYVFRFSDEDFTLFEDDVVLDSMVTIPPVLDRREMVEFAKHHLRIYRNGEPITIPARDGYKGYLSITDSHDPTEEFGEQTFQHGFTNCVLRHLAGWLLGLKEGKLKKQLTAKMLKLWEKYGDGVPETALQEVCDELVIGIRVLSPYSHTEIINVKKQSVKHIRKNFTFINTRENHVELFNDIEPIAITQQEMNDKFQLKQAGTIWKETRDGVVYFMRDSKGEYHIQEDEARETIDFKKSIQGFDIRNNEMLKSFVHKSMLRMGTVDGKASRCDSTVHIDQKNSYASYKQSPYYSGFPAFITDNVQACDRIMGEGFYFVERFNSLGELGAVDKLLGGVFVNGSVYPANILKMLTARGGEYEITCGCWGNTMDFDFPEEMITNKTYQKYIGGLECANPFNAVRVHDVNYNWLGQVEKVVACFGDRKEIHLPKDRVIYRGHIASYLMGYCACQTIEQLSRMDLGEVVRVCVDGIYTNETSVGLTGSFRFKDDLKFGNTAGGKYLPLVHYNFSDEELALWHSRTSIFPNRITLVYGAGGSGKTHYIQHYDEGMVETLFVNPSHELCAANPHVRSVTHGKLLTDLVSASGKCKWVGIASNYSTLVFDEASMLTKKQYQKIVKRFPYHKLIFAGDLGYQLPPVTEGEELFEEDFKHRIEFKNDRRSHDKETKRLKKELRRLMKEGYGVLNMFEAIYKMTSVKKPVKLSAWREAELKKLKFEKLNDDVESVIAEFVGVDFGYQVEDMIIAYTGKCCDEYTEYFKTLPKYKILKNSRHYQNGNIVYEEPKTLNSESYELRHGYTVHSSQGKTLKRRLFIDVRRFQGARDGTRLLYTAISRVNRVSQIVLIDGV